MHPLGRARPLVADFLGRALPERQSLRGRTMLPFLDSRERLSHLSLS